MLAPYRRVLDVPGAPRLLGSALFARLPQGMSTLATLLLVRAATHSYAAAGVAVGAEALATAVSAPPLGRLIDRLGRARVIVPCSLAYAALLWLLVLAAELQAAAAVLILLAGAAGTALPPVAPTVRALLRDTFTDATVRESAYALESVAQELIWILGPLLVAVVITLCSPAVALLLIGAQSMLGAWLFVRAPLARAGERPSHPPAARGAALASRTLRSLLIPIALTGAGLGATEVGLPALALHVGSRSAAGLLLALWSVGSMAGGLWYGSRAWRHSLSSRYAVLLLAAVACVAPLIVARSLGAGVVFSLFAGLTVAPVFSCQYALVGRAVTPGTETEAFTWVSAALVAGIAAGSAAGGAVVAAEGVSAPFVLACAASALAALMAFAARGGAGEPAVA